MSKKLLLVVDYQVDFVTGSLGFKEAPVIEQNIINYLDEAIAHKDDIIFTLDTHAEDYLSTQEGKNLPVKHCIKNTPGHELFGRVVEYKDKATKVFEKNTFGSLDLANYLKDKDYSEIVIVGLVTNICIVSQAILCKSALPEAKIIIDSKAVDSYDFKLHHETLAVLAGMQVTII